MESTIQSKCTGKRSHRRFRGGGVLNALLALLFCAGVASADRIDATAMYWSRAMQIDIWEDGTVVSGANTGVIFITLSSGEQLFNRDTVCIDLFTDIYLGRWYDTNVYRPDEVPRPNLSRAAWLVDNAVPPIPLAHPALPVVDSPAMGAGLQLAIWDIVHDGGDGFDNGRVRATTTTDADVLAWAMSYEDQSKGKSSSLSFVYDNFDLGTTTRAQMLIGPRYEDNGPEPSPEPRTLVLGMGVLLIGIGKFFRPRLRHRGLPSSR